MRAFTVALLLASAALLALAPTAAAGSYQCVSHETGMENPPADVCITGGRGGTCVEADTTAIPWTGARHCIPNL